MKICTDIEQSSKLLEIGISIETADMCYEIDKNLIDLKAYNLVPLNRLSKKEKTEYFINKDYIPAWSLAALLQLFPHDDTHGVELNNYCGANDRVWFIRGNYRFTFMRVKDEPIDGLVELILELKEKNLL